MLGVNWEEYQKQQQLNEEFANKLVGMTSKSKNLKKKTIDTECRIFWTNCWADLKQRQSTIDQEISELAYKYDQEPDYHQILGRTGSPLSEQISSDQTMRVVLKERFESEIGLLRSVTGELQRGVQRKEEEVFSVVEQVFGFYDTFKEDIARQYTKFILHNDQLHSLVKEVKNVDTVKGFDLQEGIDLELFADFAELGDEVGESEENLIKQYYKALDLISEQSKSELISLKESDVLNWLN